MKSFNVPSVREGKLGKYFLFLFSSTVTGLSENLGVSQVGVELKNCPKGIFSKCKFSVTEELYHITQS